MKTTEYYKLIFKTADQWESGLYSRLKITPEKGLTLFSRPTFDQWLLSEADGVYPQCLCIDYCGMIYWIDRQDCQLYRYDRKNRSKEHIQCISGCGSGPGEVKDPARILIDRHTLWLLDRGTRRVLAFETDSFQLKYIIATDVKPVDIGLDGLGHLYVLDVNDQSKQIVQYQTIGKPTGLSFGQEQLIEPVALAIGKERQLYVADRDGFYRFSEKGEFIDLVGDFSSVPDDERPFKPSLMVISSAGSILTAVENGTAIHEFGPLGGYLGQIPMPDTNLVINGIAMDGHDHLYVGTDRGLAVFTLELNFVGEGGEYYSHTLDKGLEKRPWHRLDMDADLPENTSVEISYYASDDQNLRENIDDIHASQHSVRQKIDEINNLIGPSWSEPERPTRGMLFREGTATGRFLWLKLALTTFDEARKPYLKSMRVYYPRMSYLRYLPVTYQEDPISSDFLERFLSIFETVLFDFETEIERLFRVFDPMITPEQFLPWLASWLHLALEEGLEPDVKIRLIREAASIFKKKGTPVGLADLIEILIGQRPIILEHFRFAQPFVLAGNHRLGFETVVSKHVMSGFHLGDDSILGQTVVRPDDFKPEEPFKRGTYRFTVLLNMDKERFKQKEVWIRRILDEEKPSHTQYAIRLIGEPGLGKDYYVGFNSQVADLNAFRLGIASYAGSAIIRIRGEEGTRLERNSRLLKRMRVV